MTYYETLAKCRQPANGQRIFQHDIHFDNGPRVDLTAGWGHMTITRRVFQAIVGSRFNSTLKGRLDVRLRLVGETIPWGTAIYPPNRFFIERSSYSFLISKSRPEESTEQNSRQILLRICEEEADRIFPGLTDAVGMGNTCEVEIDAKWIVPPPAEPHTAETSVC